MTRSSRVFVPPADHIFRISWDLSRDTTQSVQQNMKTYMSADNPLIPPEARDHKSMPVVNRFGTRNYGSSFTHSPVSAAPTLVDTATV